MWRRRQRVRHCDEMFLLPDTFESLNSCWTGGSKTFCYMFEECLHIKYFNMTACWTSPFSSLTLTHSSTEPFHHSPLASPLSLQRPTILSLQSVNKGNVLDLHLKEAQHMSLTPTETAESVDYHTRDVQCCSLSLLDTGYPDHKFKLRLSLWAGDTG